MGRVSVTGRGAQPCISPRSSLSRYYYNVHTKVTTWYKPTGAVPPPPPHVTEAANEAGDGISMECSMEMSGQVMAGFI